MRPADSIDKLIKKLHLSASAELDKRVHSEISKALAETKEIEPAKHKPNTWRTIMQSRITKLAAAAVITITILAGINYFGGSIDMAGVAWGEVVEKVEQIESFIFQHKMSIKGAAGMPEGTTLDIESTVYVSSEHGLRQDQYMAGKAISIQYVPPSGTIVTALMPHMKKYIMASMTEEQIRNIHEEINPTGMIKKFMSFDHTELGKKVIDGIEAEGIEVDDPKLGSLMFERAKGRLWVDVQTDLPVRIEVEGVSGGGAVETKAVAYDFDWHAKLDPGIFEPNIPDDYVLHGEIDVSDDEGEAVKGLRAFAELVGGQ